MVNYFVIFTMFDKNLVMKSSVLKALSGKWPLYLLLITLIACSKKDSTTGNSSGNTDKCKGVVCDNGGTCKDGLCDCLPGYEGNKCEILSRDKYLGTYEGVSKGNGHINPDGIKCTVVITANASDEKMLNVSGLLYTISSPYTPPPCKAFKTEFSYHDPTVQARNVRGWFEDGNTNKLAITWFSDGGELQRFEGLRK